MEVKNNGFHQQKQQDHSKRLSFKQHYRSTKFKLCAYIYDEFMVYVCDNKNATNARANLTTGVSVKVTGELRIWHDGSYRICANDIQPIW